MDYNVQALTTLHKRITDESNRGGHRQHVWGAASNTGQPEWPKVSCPTSACAAGWAVIEAGDRMLMLTPQAFVPGSYVADYCEDSTGQQHNIAERAAQLLGLTLVERKELFRASPSTAETLDSIACIIRAAKHGLTWAEQRRKEWNHQ